MSIEFRARLNTNIGYWTGAANPWIEPDPTVQCYYSHLALTPMEVVTSIALHTGNNNDNNDNNNNVRNSSCMGSMKTVANIQIQNIGILITTEKPLDFVSLQRVSTFSYILLLFKLSYSLAKVWNINVRYSIAPGRRWKLMYPSRFQVSTIVMTTADSLDQPVNADCTLSLLETKVKCSWILLGVCPVWKTYNCGVVRESENFLPMGIMVI